MTAGNASGVNDGAAALLIASAAAVKQHGLTPIARITAAATAGVAPRIMGFGPAPATQKLMQRLGLGIGAFEVIELNEAFASQALAVTRALGLPDDAAHVNPNGGAIALGHPLGCSGARISQEPPRSSSRIAAAKGHCPRCASVSGRGSPSRSSMSDTWRAAGNAEDGTK